MKFKSIVISVSIILFIIFLFCGCMENNEVSKYVECEATLLVNSATTYQTLKGFGVSGAWWAKEIGGVTAKAEDGREYRDIIASLLFDKEKGTGVSIYRYNLGANVYPDDGNYHSERRGESFLTVDGTYDFTRDSEAKEMLDRALKLGVTDVVLFSNSPPNTMTKNGKAQCSNENECNLEPENYSAYCKYLCDIAEHFVSEGVPVSAISPINEPQWGWTDGQEGCHYSVSEAIALLRVLKKEKDSRPLLSEVEIEFAEGGEWKNMTLLLYSSLCSAKDLKEIDSFCAHSYWSTASDKKRFQSYRDNIRNGRELQMTEWCEMVNGRDSGMDSAFNMAECMLEDLNILQVTSWQYWIAVSRYDYRDGLIYVNDEGIIESVTKRLWTMAHFSRFLPKGTNAVESKITSKTEKAVNVDYASFKTPDGSLVVVISNRNEKIALDLSEINGYKEIKAYVTDSERDLSKIQNAVKGNAFIVPEGSITTLVFSK